MKKAVCFFNIIMSISLTLKGQELDPRRYASLPKNMNALGLAYGVSSGNVVSDPTLPIADFSITAQTAVLGYVRTFGLAGKLSRIAVAVPYTFLSGNLTVNGHDTSGVRAGFDDAQLRFGMNLIGSPLQDKQQFVHFEQKTIVGASIVISMPTGQYDNSKYINLGNNRWGIKPEIGVSKRFERFYLEAYTGVWFYTKNNNYLGGKIRSQHPVFSIQAHACYYFKNQMWVSLNTTLFKGGVTYVNNSKTSISFDNWRIGGTWSLPIARGQSIKLQVSAGAFATRGYNYNSFSMAYQVVFF
ncbi:MAG: transporter [Bacteroidetes bacterium]|nr:MAG: transporter [Bacteroidota bacterium]